MATKEKNIKIEYHSRKSSQQDVVYTQPKPFNRNRFLLRLLTVAAVVLALLFGMSIFFKVQDVQVSGTVKYDAWTVREASGIVEGENLFTLSKARISSTILAELPYVESVRIGIRLPDTVIIQVTELEIVYAIQDIQDSWWLINANGRIVDTCLAAEADDYTKIIGIKLNNPIVGEMAAAYQEQPTTNENEETVPVTVYASERLDTAVTIVQYMEATGLIGKVTSVDVSDIGDIELWYGTRFQMLLGDSSALYRKVDALSQAVAQLDDYDRGILDASFTYWPDQVGYSQFS